jgi:feruloyl esterase
MLRPRSVGALMTLCIAAGAPGSLYAASSCEGLRSLTSPSTTITVAELVPSGPLASRGPSAEGRTAAPVLPRHCRVAATLKPSPDSSIEIEVWLPVDNWNGKFQAVGNGGWAGAISIPAMAVALRDGYATASTDTGHTGATAQFAVGHPEKVTDFAYRAVHEMTVTAKKFVAAFYGRAPRLSYFSGCSTGGRQGMMAAQRYPDDFDGIVAGAPVYNMVRLSAANVAHQMDIFRDSTRLLPREKIALVANAALAACDANDGVKDGIVSNPESCAFNPATLACTAGDGPGCLTAPQVESVRRVYAGVSTKAGEFVYPGSSRGFEAGLRMPQGTEPLPLHLDMFRYVGRQDPKWSAAAFDLDADLALALKNGGVIEANDPNLAAFKARGGKLLLYHGWADPGPSPANTIDYVSRVERALAGTEENWLRLFLLPGVGHCGGGAGPDQADFVGALERWREAGVAPDRIRASRVNANRVTMTRPLCPYPQIAQYTGVGSTNDAENFVCRPPRSGGGTK